MKILREGEDVFRMTLSSAEARILVNCMNETIKQIGTREYATRMSANIDQIRTLISALETALA